MSSDKVDTTRTDKDYWDAQLKSHNLGMNRGTTFFDDDEAPVVSVREIEINVGGRPRKPKPPKGERPKLNKKEITNAARATLTPDALGGMFQCGGFRYISSSKLVGGGRGKKGGSKGPEGGRDDRRTSGAFIQYVGSISDLATLEESLDREESGRVRPGGHRPR